MAAIRVHQITPVRRPGTMADKKAMSRDDELYLESLYCEIREFLLDEIYREKIIERIYSDDYNDEYTNTSHIDLIYYHSLRVNDRLYRRMLALMKKYDIGDRPSDIIEFMIRIPF